MASLGERMAMAEAQIAAMIEQRSDRDCEVKAIKESIRGIDSKIDQLIEDKAHRDGAISLGRWLIGIGIPSLIGGWVLAIWHFLEGKN